MAAPPLVQDFETYRAKYRHIWLRREDGIVELSVHSDGGPLLWCDLVHDELGFCFADLANDAENRAVIITGTGSHFCTEVDIGSFGELSPREMLRMHHAGMRLIDNLLAIPVPVIGAVNGPAHIHAELLLLSNVVVASETASFRDKAHFSLGIVPGDGVHVAWPALLGPTRGSCFLLMDEVLDVEQARALGIVHEVVPQAQLQARTWEVARQIASKPVMASSYARLLLTQELKRAMLENLSHGLAVECLAMLDQ